MTKTRDLADLGGGFIQAGTGAQQRTVESKLQDVVSVKDFGAVGDGVADDTVAIQNAVNAANGGTLYFPKPQNSYLLNSSISKPSDGISTLMDPGVTFSGAGSMFQSYANNFHDYNGTFFGKNAQFIGTPGDGYSSISADFTAQSTFSGNGCAGFFSTETPANAVGFYWAINPILELNPGLTGNGITCEIDLDNFSSNGKGQGLLVSGVGSSKPQVGVAVQRGDLTSDWQYGQWIKNSEYGLLIDGTDVVSPQFGAVIQNYAQNLLKFKPLNDTNPSDAVVFLSNAADSQVNWKLTKRGGIQIGNAAQEILAHYSNTAVLNFGTVGANTTSELTVTVTGASQGDSCVATPNLALTPGFTWSAYCTSADTVTVRLANVTTGALDPDGGGGATWRVDVWKH